MDETKKNIDELVATRTQKQAELLVIGRKIATSATPIVVAFVDLTESTQMKQDREPEEWLGFVFEFIQRCYPISSPKTHFRIRRRAN